MWPFWWPSGEIEMVEAAAVPYNGTHRIIAALPIGEIHLDNGTV